MPERGQNIKGPGEFGGSESERGRVVLESGVQLRTCAIAFWSLLFSLPHVGEAVAQCEPGEPAIPVPMSLWPEDLRPSPTPRAMNQLPDDRDSTDYLTTTIPGVWTGHELFESVAVVGERLFVAYNAGISVWDIEGNQDMPRQLTYREGWQDHWLDFREPGEADSFITDISALPLDDGGALVVVGGESPISSAIWRYEDGAGLTQLYQGEGDGVHAVDLVRFGGRYYAFVATINGVSILNVSAAMEGEPCLETWGSGSCPGVYVGELPGILRSYSSAAYVYEDDAGEHLLFASANLSAPGVQLYEISDADRPESATEKTVGFGAVANGIDLFEADGEPYLGLARYVARPGSSEATIEVYALRECLGSNCSLDAAVTASPSYDITGGRRTLRHSFDDRDTTDPSDDEHFLYLGYHRIPASPPDSERLVHLGGLREGGVTRGLTDGGPTYADECTAEDVGYWGWYYRTADNGLRNMAPRTGIFVHDRFYRVARAIFDVHTWTRPELVIAGDDAGTGGDAGILDAGAPVDAAQMTRDAGSSADASRDAGMGNEPGGCACKLMRNQRGGSGPTRGQLLFLMGCVLFLRRRGVRRTTMARHDS